MFNFFFTFCDKNLNKNVKLSQLWPEFEYRRYFPQTNHHFELNHRVVDKLREKLIFAHKVSQVIVKISQF